MQFYKIKIANSLQDNNIQNNNRAKTYKINKFSPDYTLLFKKKNTIFALVYLTMKYNLKITIWKRLLVEKMN